MTLDKSKMPRPMAWYNRKEDGALLYGYLLSPAEVVEIEIRVLDLVLEGLASEDDSVQVRAIRAEVQAMRDKRA